MTITNEIGSIELSIMDEYLLLEAIKERIQITDFGTKKHQDYKKLYEKLSKINNTIRTQRGCSKIIFNQRSAEKNEV